MSKLLLEIGTEELPAGYIEPALRALSDYISGKLDEFRIDHGRAWTFGTPRRLAVIVDDMADKQRSSTTEVIGPPERVGLDQFGKPTVAAEKFAEKIGVSLNDIQIAQTAKGSYLSAVKTEIGGSTQTVLQTLLPSAVLATPFPKSMKWGDLNITFARPIHNIVALLGDQPISFELGGIESGRSTAGHRFMSPGRIEIRDAESYVNLLEQAEVIVDFAARKDMAAREVAEAARQIGGKVLEDDDLLNIVTNLVEMPVATAGSFDDAYLELPGEILITAMRRHQKYFAVIDDSGNLMSSFIAVNNTRTKDLSLVATGHERVLRARLADARFFYQADLKVSFDRRVEKLKGVLFQAKLGTMHQKVIRIQKLGGYLADELDRDEDVKRHVLRAAMLCKADLVSEVVGEFPELQGVMGRIYAAVAGEHDHVAAAIEEHYRPTHSGGPQPETTVGALLSIADKLDSICGCFSVGLVPTGASDPYALRRQGIGIIQIMLSRGFDFSLAKAIEKSIKLFGAKSVQEIEAIKEQVITFLVNRITHLMVEDDIPKDIVAAVVSKEYLDPLPDIWNRARALQALKGAPDFEPLVIAFKRVVNIIKQSGLTDPARQAEKLDPKLFSDPSEAALLDAFARIDAAVAKELEKGRFDQALREVAALRKPVDDFFDGVMVMAEDARIRENRLALLARIAVLFAKFADFSKINT